MKALYKTALEWLEIESAINICRSLGDASMVQALRRLEHVEDKFLLAGHVALLLDNHDLAQDMFLKSSSPIEALNMHRDLLHWDQALKLAQKLAPEEIPFISRECAQLQEFNGNWSSALQMYEAGSRKSGKDRAHDEACRLGLARMLVRTGDIKRGAKMAEEINSRTLYREIGSILESMSQNNEAAQMFEKAEQYDKAAAIYIKGKNWAKAGELLKQVTTPKLHAQYAKAREADGSYKEAAAAYESARDYLSVIRLNLDHLRNPDEAVRIVKETGSVDGAKMVAKFFQKLGDIDSAIQFLVMSHCNQEAFAMAQEHGKMDAYASLVGDEAGSADCRSIAETFEKKGNMLEAGRFYTKAEDYKKALRILLKCSSDDGSHIDVAIETVGLARSEDLTNQLIDYLMGETDNTPKEAKYLFKLYMALKQFREAARTAIVIAREEQVAGNYRNAHDVLFSMYIQLQKEGIRVPAEMSRNLLILHSYILVKLHVKRNDHIRGARMLIRVADNISKFPAHIVNILTSTVIECHRSGLKNSSFNYAAMLLRPEYRNKVDPKYKKKIEQIVRKPDKSEIPEDETPCPFCKEPLPATQLQCNKCENLLPYCIATGQHMIMEDWGECPHCHFPALYSDFCTLLETEENCPMCSHALTAGQVVKVPDAESRLRASKESVEKYTARGDSSEAPADENAFL